MDYVDAKKLKERNLHLIGTTDTKGFIIGDVVIVPTDTKQLNAFFAKYLSCKDAEVAIAPYIHSDLEVWAIDTKHLYDANILFYNKL